MYSVRILLPGGTSFELCQAEDLLTLWGLVESLIGPGTSGLNEMTIVRLPVSLEFSKNSR